MSYVCPICERESFNPNDELHGWCGACHGYTSEPPPPGMAWVVFTGGPDGTFGRLMVEGYIEQAAEYTTVYNDARYVYDGKQFVFQEPA